VAGSGFAQHNSQAAGAPVATVLLTPNGGFGGWLRRDWRISLR
jgi:hypothetical protein